MKKLDVSPVGGFPFVLGDLNLLDETYRESLYNLFTAFGVTINDTFILSGCVRSGVDPINLTTGFIVIEGEICKVDAQSWPFVPGNTENWEKYDIVIPAGDKTLENAAPHSAYRETKARIKINGSGVQLNVTNNIFQVIQSKTVHSQLLFNAVVKAVANIDGLSIIGKAAVTGNVECDQEIKAKSKMQCRVLFELLADVAGTNNRRVVFSRSTTTDRFGVRVDEINGTPNFNGLFEFIEDGDMTFSNLYNRIRDRTTNTIIGSSSDKRLKKDIKPLGGVLDKIMSLIPVTFKFKKSKQGATTEHGFIAQDVKELFPNLIDTADSEEAYMSLDYAKMTSILVKGMQEQQEVINGLESRIQALESK